MRIDEKVMLVVVTSLGLVNERKQRWKGMATNKGCD